MTMALRHEQNSGNLINHFKCQIAVSRKLNQSRVSENFRRQNCWLTSASIWWMITQWKLINGKLIITHPCGYQNTWKKRSIQVLLGVSIADTVFTVFSIGFQMSSIFFFEAGCECWCYAKRQKDLKLKTGKDVMKGHAHQNHHGGPRFRKQNRLPATLFWEWVEEFFWLFQLAATVALGPEVVLGAHSPSLNNVDDYFFCSPFRLFTLKLACYDNLACNESANCLTIECQWLDNRNNHPGPRLLSFFANNHLSLSLSLSLSCLLKTQTFASSGFQWIVCLTYSCVNEIAETGNNSIWINWICTRDKKGCGPHWVSECNNDGQSCQLQTFNHRNRCIVHCECHASRFVVPTLWTDVLFLPVCMDVYFQDKIAGCSSPDPAEDAKYRKDKGETCKSG